MDSRFAPFEAFVFDMDGVLLDTEILYKQAAFKASADLGFEMTDEVHRATIGVPADAGDLIIKTAMGEDFPFDRFNLAWRGWMRDRLAESVPVKRGALELLSAIKARGIPAAVATSTGRDAAMKHLKQAGLLGFLQTVVTRDDVQNGKPDPEPFLTAAQRLGVDPRLCVALEDSYNGIRSAHGAGMQVIMVPDMLEPTESIAKLCAAVLPSLHHVMDAVFPDR